MTRQEVIDILEKHGYKSYPPPHFKGDYAILWAGSRRLPKTFTNLKVMAGLDFVPMCDTNENKISWHVNVYDWDIPGGPCAHKYQSIEIDIVAEKHGQWFKLSCYAIPWYDTEELLLTNIMTAERCLLNSWIACARS